MLTLEINGIKPEAQARPRFANGFAYSPKTDYYRAVFAHAIAKRPRIPLDGPLCVSIEFRFERPASVKSTQLLKWTRPDLDNLIKSTYDAISKARVWADDARIAKSTEDKKYAKIPGVTIRIEQMSDPEWRPKP